MTARGRDQYRDDMIRRRVHLTGRWPTLAETARVFKLSAATQRRISREVAEFLKEYKEALAAGNGRDAAVKPPRRAARKAAYHAGRAIHVR